MRSRWLIPVVAIIVAVAGGVAASARPGVLPARTITAGAVDIVIEPIRIDDAGALFRVVMDTHSEELSADPARTSVLEVNGVEWTGATWSGDPAGGHHRGGELAFEASGPAAGSVVLSIGGFSAPVQTTWTLSG